MLPATNAEDGRQNDAWHRVPLKPPLPPLIPGSAEYPGLGRIGDRPLCPRGFSEDVRTRGVRLWRWVRSSDQGDTSPWRGTEPVASVVANFSREKSAVKLGRGSRFGVGTISHSKELPFCRGDRGTTYVAQAFSDGADRKPQVLRDNPGR
jgi:hypothetical protein